MKNIFWFGLFIIIFAFQNDSVYAETIPLNARFFIGSTLVDPQNLNTELTAQSLKNIDSITAMGVEATHSIFSHLDWGFRYTKRTLLVKELVDNPATDYQGELNQDSVMLLLRVPFFKSDIFRADFFGGVGGSNTKFKIKTASQDGELTRAKSGDWFATPYTSFGGSVAVGYKKFYFVVEGGVESNKVDKLERTGTVNTNVNTIDLSGSYITVGLLFDGLSGTRK
jgi:hypothetical protein